VTEARSIAECSSQLSTFLVGDWVIKGRLKARLKASPGGRRIARYEAREESQCLIGISHGPFV